MRGCGLGDWRFGTLEEIEAGLDDAGAVRRHVAVFANDDLITDRTSLTDTVVDGDRIHVFQALSGG